MRTASALFMLAVVALVAGCSEEKTEAPEIIRPVLSMVIEPQDAGQQGFAGSIEPQVSASLAFRLLGRVVAREVDVGDMVQKGATIASLDPAALQLQLQAAKADLSSAEAQLANASASEERQRALLESKNTPAAVYEAALQARESAQANLEQARAALAKAEEQLGYTQLFSDFDGVVTATGAEIGQVVSPGQMVVTVARSDVREAVVDIPDQLAAGLKEGEAFTVVLQSASTITAEGKVREVAPQADAATRSRRVRLSLVDPPAAFRLGSTVTVTRAVAVSPQIILPASALLEQDGKTSVWLVDAASASVSQRPVTVAAAGPGYFVIESGIDAGARVVTAGVHSLKEGQKIKLDEVQP